MKTFPTIYKKTATGAIQQWHQELNPENPIQYRTVSGQVGGALVYSTWRDSEGTNVGRSNERTPEDQAIFEIESNYKKKLSVDYHENVDNVNLEKIFEPMLAKEYGKSKISFPVYSQPKLDGMRCIAKEDGLWSRSGKPIISCPHIFDILEPLFQKYEGLILDGELYNHEYKNDFNSIISSARKTKPSTEDLEVSFGVIEYHVYDLPSESHLNFSERFNLLESILSDINPKIKLVRTNRVDNQTDLDNLYGDYLSNGYEGQMVRLDSSYENKRSKHLLKRKESRDLEFELVDIEEGIGNYYGIAKKAILKLPDGRLFGAGITGTQEFNRNLLLEKHLYIGKPTTVVFFDYTPDGIPRFGRIKEFNRNDNI
jgi:DNA ligase-1